ncbi:MAG: DNA repair protein RecN [Bacteroidia bacterium]|nr:DNA repair protein RecN [Bacteroidia bacterium]
MLLKLTVSNFAIIRHVVFEPCNGLNIITGETGAGKSIILDAFDLILGARADVKSLGDPNEKCVVEGEFALNKDKFEAFFSENEIDFEELTILRREINVNGKSRSFINDTPVTLQVLKEIGLRLVSLHSQHENTQMNDRDFQFNLLDDFAGNSELIKNYKTQFLVYKNTQAELENLKSEQINLIKEKDYLEFLINEFEQVNLKLDEEAQLESELDLLNKAEQIVNVADQINTTLIDSEASIADALTQLRNKLRPLESVSDLSKDIVLRLNSSIIEIKDIADDSLKLKESVIYNEGRTEFINERLASIQHLKRKHNITEFNELLVVSEQIADQLFNIGNMDRKVEDLELALKQMYLQLSTLAKSLHSKRVEAADLLKSAIENSLKSLEMPHALIDFSLELKSDLDDYGCSALNLLFSANPGSPLQSLNKVASGGELSRLALSIRTIEAGNRQLNTLIFDEIDTGVSGKVADTIGKMFNQIARSHQILAITHLPQVAGYGQKHFFVGKEVVGNSTVSYIKDLNKSERVDELAKMLSGDAATEIAKKNAMELLKV